MSSRTQIWKQDPFVTEIGVRKTLITSEVKDGPKDSGIVVEGTAVARGDLNRDFITALPGSSEFDSVHTFSVVRQVVNLFKRDIQRINEPGDSGRPRPLKPIVWKWQWESKEGSVPIKVFPQAGQDENAYYDRAGKQLAFFYFNDVKTGKKVYTCRSFEIVSHETGHAVLDALRPDLWGDETPQAGGIHEAFGDITAIFASLAQLDICEAVIVASKANLHNKTFFSIMGEEFGNGLGRPTGFGLRNADNDLKLSEVEEEVHSISQVLTGAIYDILAEIFAKELQPTRYDPAETLLRVGNQVRLLFLAAIIFMEKRTYADIANKMIEFEPNKDYKAIIKKEFERREVFISGTTRVKAPMSLKTGENRKKKRTPSKL
jgi:hypothetical protein